MVQDRITDYRNIQQGLQAFSAPKLSAPVPMKILAHET